MSEHITKAESYSELCMSCIHHKVCSRDKNIVGDIFVAGNPAFFDNKKLYEEYKAWEAAGFPCNEYLKASDVVGVRHGKWIRETLVLPLSNATKEAIKCSECGTHWDLGDESNYCPFCGAKMDKENEHE